ncbi:hypothetical protein [Thioalkalivibrio sp. AKL10]|uniref:LEM-3-like GIY-YIG domain-containing protein n=1 Tax=Thioalkalivibrio sp. AKL10 TaxID=1158158 RepID=UPI00036100D1|nr:hypothetical protein [Thioalkalivibrio sp. AKL10]
MFSDFVCQAIGYYVYRLVDPRNGETFYVGRGQGNRVFQHAKGEISAGDDESGEMDPKRSKIEAIRNAGLDVIHIIHRHDIPSLEVVSEVEAALIDAYPGLTNAQGGAGSGDRGPMSAKEVVDKYELPELAVLREDQLVLININAIENRASVEHIYDQVRYAWRIDARRAAKAKHVLAVIRGVVVGAFTVEEWLEAKQENFPGLMKPREDIQGRYGFVGKPAEAEDWERFVGQRGRRIVQSELKHVQNPIRYWNV